MFNTKSGYFGLKIKQHTFIETETLTQYNKKGLTVFIHEYLEYLTNFIFFKIIGSDAL